MNIFEMDDGALLKRALHCRCPKCDKGDLFQDRFSLELKPRCNHCGLDYTKNDTADGPAVFLIFVLGTLLVPLALALDAFFTVPLWVHAVLWTIVSLVLTVGTLKPVKSCVFALQLKYRASDWDKE